MKDPGKIDFKKHTSPPASKKYLIRVLFYILIFSVLGYLMFHKYKNRGNEQHDTVEEIHSLTIETVDSL